jgi:YVTN family beta-propeller protein
LADKAEIRTFLIADVRGYTLFTQERGDEAAAKLAKRFAGIAREGVGARGGSVIELRGDEALAVFASPRQAIRAAVDLQQRFVDETLDDPSLPLMVGIGLDAGEAVPVEGGYRGGALNMAARLCGQAGPGEILATPEMVHLARAVEGVRYRNRGTLHLKGIAEPVRVTRVIPEERDPVAALAPIVAERARAAPRRPRRLGARWKWGAAAVSAIVALAVIVPVLLTGGSSLSGFSPDSVGLIDTRNGSLLKSVDLPGRPHSVAVGHGAAWVTHPTRGSVSKIDTKTLKVEDQIPVGNEPTGIAVSDDAVWVANSADRTLSRIDPDTDDIVDTIPVGNGPTGIQIAFGSVWVVNAVDGSLARVDPETRVVTRMYVGDGPTGIAADDDSLWITNSAGATVSRVSPRSMAVLQPYNVGNGPAGLAVASGDVWVANRLDGTVSRVDSTTNAVTALPAAKGPGAVAAAGGAVWVANEFDGTISRIDTRTEETRSIAVGNAPSSLASAGDTLWVTVGAAAPSHVGGTLEIVSREGPRGSDDLPTIDPALAYDNLAWQIFVMTNDGLVGFRRVAGAEGSLLVPDLATSLPRPTDGGTTFTFQVRPNIRYSTGGSVRPQDFRRAIERVYTTGSLDAAAIYDGIVGSDRCTENPGRCDFSAGIETTDETITFHLERPDPDFLYKLALPFAFAVPSGTPVVELKGPAPATGPYMFRTYDPKDGFVLVRNPHFREWSHIAQPAGYPDRIDWRFGVDEQEALDQVLAGRTDWFSSGVTAPLGFEALTRDSPELVHRSPLTQTLFMSLGTTKSPFDDVRVRRALNLAVDRVRVVELIGGPNQARATCQILPPGFPGYEPYCPYTVDPDREGTWTGPDLIRAQQLIRQSGVGGEDVEVWGFPLVSGGVGYRVSRYFTELLNELGLHATHRRFTNVDTYFSRVYAEKPQIAIVGWVQDYPAPSNFFVPLLSCEGFANSTGLCDRQVDRMIDRARALQTVDPPRAYELWARIERRLVDLAPLVPLVNPVGVEVVSARVGNYQRSPQWGLLIDQLWVR